MNVTKEEKVQEAVLRMKTLRMRDDLISEFVRNGKLYCYRDGELETLSQEFVELVQRFEADVGGVVYYLIFTESEFGDLLTMLYISDYKEEWYRDMLALKDMVPFAYVENLQMPVFSEFGSVQLVTEDGRTLRVL